jgi:hypothetical protein
MKKIKEFLKTHTKKIVLVSVITVLLVGLSSGLGDWRKGSSATLQANISLDASAFRNSELNDSIHVYQGSDYKQCLKSVVINPSWCTLDHNVTATCSSTSSGWCWAGESSKFQLKFRNSDDVEVGYVEFYEAYATHFELHAIKSYNGYLITVKTEVVNRASTFEVKITVD